jgi:uncharacterized protein (TIGR00730 family)
MYKGDTMNITVFLGSNLPKDPIYRQAAEELGRRIAKSNNTLLYGGAKVGTMGILADATLNAGGEVIGIMPSILSNKEIIHPRLTKTILVDDMYIRKEELLNQGDVFIVLPGGCGTMDEIFEIITLNQIGSHQKPYAFINIDHYYDGIKLYLENATRLGFMSQENLDKIHFFNSIDDLFNSGLI